MIHSIQLEQIKLILKETETWPLALKRTLLFIRRQHYKSFFEVQWL